ncbi:LacI family DNA-binding transcriptional regulator [Paenibacillus methanolicus]|uniref:LacI family transcriptional regulator n=1 Tax=Paenibacillus methanolicus TaxID=582686 RepID=A0A5S5CAZ7_9BACL|nr:LacI family DNA-binding transcriptional regulator [Paenibacillus methanolicus]TYP75510.1 LacI family transcriptional regulator [Paenibacillus methanolicus]
MKASIYDVAKRAGLSVVTVSRVLNNESTVREKNRLKVLEVMRELDYHPKAAARSLAKGKTNLIGMMLSTLDDSFFDAVIKEISDRLAAKGYYLTLSVDSDLSPMLFQEDRVDGVILLSPINEIAHMRELDKRKIPYILIDHQHPAPSVSSIVVDNYAGSVMAANHLLALGHKDIAHITGPPLFLSSRERERGFRHAMREAGLAPFAVVPGEFQIASGLEAADRWLAAGRLPTAVFAADDYTAIGVITALQAAGVRVPRDVSVIGFDDQVIASQYRPALTTIRQPAEHIGRQAVDIMLATLQGELPTPAKVELKPELVVRASTAKPRGE